MSARNTSLAPSSVMSRSVDRNPAINYPRKPHGYVASSVGLWTIVRWHAAVPPESQNIEIAILRDAAAVSRASRVDMYVLRSHSPAIISQCWRPASIRAPRARLVAPAGCHSAALVYPVADHASQHEVCFPSPHPPGGPARCGYRDVSILRDRGRGGRGRPLSGSASGAHTHDWA